MANKKKEIYRVKPLNENKKNIIAALIDEYDIENADDLQEALKDLLGGAIKSMMEAEMDEHLGYESYECSGNQNYRNSTYKKLNRQRTVFPRDTALLKSLYLSTLQATKKWNRPLRNRAKFYGEFSIMYEGRLPI